MALLLDADLHDSKLLLFFSFSFDKLHVNFYGSLVFLFSSCLLPETFFPLPYYLKDLYNRARELDTGMREANLKNTEKEKN